MSRNSTQAFACSWKVWVLVCALVLTACGKQGAVTSGTNSSAAAPNLSYATNPAYYALSTAITPNALIADQPVSLYSISPALPAGLSFDTTTGKISGAPTVQTAATVYTVTGTNAYGSNFVILVLGTGNVPQGITYPSGGSFNFTVNQSVGTITPTYTLGPITNCTLVTPASMPPGLALNGANCSISGTPTATQASTPYTVQGGNAAGNATANFNIQISNPPPPSINFSPNSYIFVYNSSISAITPTNSGGPFSSCTISPNLTTNTGLNFNATTCQITGTPTALSPSTNYTVTPNGGAGVTVTIGVVDQPPSISFSGSPYTFYDNTAITPINATRIMGSTVTGCSSSPALPSGVTVTAVGGTCQIGGTPTLNTVSPATNYSITPSNSVGSGPSTTINIQVLEKVPNISYAGSPFTFTQNSAIPPASATNTGGGNIAACSSSPPLPGGLSISQTTCQITGTPSTVQAAANYNVTATNSAGTSAITTISITVNGPGAPNLSYAGSPYTWNAGASIGTITPTNSGGAVTSCSVSPALPGGVSLSSVCALSGTPTAGVGQAATNYTISATNVSGTQNVNINITIITVPVLSYPGSPYTFTKGVAISKITPTNTGSAATSCGPTPALPAGLTLAADCSITGTPTALSVSPGTTSSLANSNADGSGTNPSITIIVNDVAPTISYSPITYTFNKGVAITTVTPTLGGGAIPAGNCSINPNLNTNTGLTFNTNNCQISGTPTKYASAQSYTVTATNSGGSASQNLSIAVNDSIPAISYAGNPFSFTINTSIGAAGATTAGGGAVTSCSISPALPAGLSLDTACNITGTPTVGSNATNYTVSATNSGGTQNLSITITVNTAPVITYSPSSYTFTKGVAISTVIPTNTGYGGITNCQVAPALPAGLTLGNSAGVWCQISGTPTAITGATAYTVTAKNGALVGAGATVTITVNDAAPTLSYGVTSNIFPVNQVISNWNATAGGGAITSCTSSPALPAGLAVNNTTCQITGTPTVTAASATYTITASNTGGSATANLTIQVKNDAQILFYSKQKVGGVTANSYNIWQADVTGTTISYLTGNTAAGLDSTYPSFIGAGGSAVFASLMKIGGISTLSYNIWTMNASTAVPTNGGASQNNLTGNTAGAADVYDSSFNGNPCNVGNCTPVWNPAGTKIAFASKQALSGVANGGALNCYNIFIMNTNGSGVIALTKNNGAVGFCGDSVSPVFSTDGNTVFFASKQGNATTTAAWNKANNANYNIWKIDTGGVTLTLLTNQNGAGLDSTEPMAVSDGVTIVFSSKMKIAGSNASQNIWSMHTDGTLQTALTQNNTLASADSKNPIVSPDGSEIAYASLQNSTTTQTTWNVAGPSSSYNIWKMKIDGSNLVQLTTNSAASFDSVSPSWEPDNLYIAFQSKQKVGGLTPASWNIWTMKQDGTSQVHVTGNTAGGLDSYLNSGNNVWYQP